MFRIAAELAQQKAPVVIPAPSTIDADPEVKPTSDLANDTPDLGTFSVDEVSGFLSWVAEAFRPPARQPKGQPLPKKGKSRGGVMPCPLHAPKSDPQVRVRKQKAAHCHRTCAGFPVGKCPQTHEAALAQQWRRRGELCNRCGLAENRAKRDGTYTSV